MKKSKNPKIKKNPKIEKNIQESLQEKDAKIPTIKSKKWENKKCNIWKNKFKKFKIDFKNHRKLFEKIHYNF